MKTFQKISNEHTLNIIINEDKLFQSLDEDIKKYEYIKQRYEKYEKKYQVFKKLYPVLQPVFDEVANVVLESIRKVL